MRDEAKLNEGWYGSELKFSKYAVEGPAGVVEVVPANASSAYGFRGNYYVVDEITHWDDRGEAVWTAIASGREKVPGSVLVAICNAWVRGSWQEKLLIDPALESDKLRRTLTGPPRDEKEAVAAGWVTFYRVGQLASWMTPARVEGIRKLLPPAHALRVLDNVPIDPVVEAGYLTPGAIAACVDPTAPTHDRRRPGFSYVLSLDYGPKRDRTALSVLHLEERGYAVVDELYVLRGKNFLPKGEVPIHVVAGWLRSRMALYKPAAIVMDPYQMLGTIQDLEAEGQPVVRYNARGGAGNMELAMTLRAQIAHRHVLWHPDAGLIPGEKDDTFQKELAALVTKVMPYGWRLDHESGAHDDRAVSVGMGLVEVLKHPYVLPSNLGGEPLAYNASPPSYGYERSPGVLNPLTGR
jgi:hypothetical protein